jgi:hypothetical protein
LGVADVVVEKTLEVVKRASVVLWLSSCMGGDGGGVFGRVRSRGGVLFGGSGRLVAVVVVDGEEAAAFFARGSRKASEGGKMGRGSGAFGGGKEGMFLGRSGLRRLSQRG